MLDFLRAKKSDPRSEYAKTLNIPEGEPILVEYFSKDVSIPSDFLSLTSPPPDAKPITLTPIDFKNTSVPEFEGRYAVVLDNVLSPSECQALQKLAESSIDMDRLNKFWKTDGDINPWRPAMVNAGQGYEVLDSGYRNSDRIVWDCEEVVDRLWARCLQGEVGETLKKALGVLDGKKDEKIVGTVRKGQRWEIQPQRWEMRGLNKRMRFLKYGPAQFFRRECDLPPPSDLGPRLTPSLAHCDGSYSEKINDKIFRTFFTVHLYLNDSVAEVGAEAELVGGATSFVSNGGDRKLNVDPKAGRVLIFQHRGLYHAGDDVVEGTKYTMRAEVMYELIEKSQWSPVES